MRRTLVAASGVILAAVAVAILVGLQAHLTAADAAARTDALAAAKERVPDLLSYDTSTLRTDLERALAQTTGSFTDDFRQVLTDVVQPTAKRRGISTVASLSAAGVVSGDRDEVVVLVFLTQTTTAKGDRSSVSGSRVEVTMKRDGDAWKIAGLKPI
jgi:Mce-associated membrane protein